MGQHKILDRVYQHFVTIFLAFTLNVFTKVIEIGIRNAFFIKCLIKDLHELFEHRNFPFICLKAILRFNKKSAESGILVKAYRKILIFY